LALNAKTAGNSQGPKQDNLEPDVYPGRLVQIIDYGLQAQKPYQGKEKPPVNVVGFTYELVTEFMKDDEGNDIEDKPRWISEMMPLHNLKADKAKSTQRYKAFDPTEQYDGDFVQCLDTPVNIIVTNNQVGDKLYVNVGDVTAMNAKKALACPELKNPAKYFDLDAPDMDIFKSLPEWVQKKICENLNFSGSKLEKLLKGGTVEKAKAKPAPEKDEDKDDDAPY
jgi:hypothetical protein